MVECGWKERVYPVWTFPLPLLLLRGVQGEGNMRAVLVQAPRINFIVCLAVMERTGAATCLGEMYTTILPLP